MINGTNCMGECGWYHVGNPILMFLIGIEIARSG